MDKTIGNSFILTFRKATEALTKELHLEPDLESQEPTAAMASDDGETSPAPEQTPEQQRIQAALDTPEIKAVLEKIARDAVSYSARGSGPRGPPGDAGPPGPPGDTGPAGTNNASQAQAIKVKPEDISFFNPGGQYQEDIFSLGRYTIYKDIFQFSDRVDNIITTYGEE